jgi:hypothetical protein
LTQKKSESKIIVLKKTIDEKDASKIVENKKTSLFKKLLKKPKQDEVHVHSLKLYYESMLIVSGKYVADYYRKATHTISVDSNVQEVVFGDGIFPIRSKSTLQKAFDVSRGKNKIDLELEEHVFIEEENELIFDHHGKEIKSDYKTDSKSIENYPQRLLDENSSNVKKPEIITEDAIDELKDFLKKPMEKDVRKLNDEFILNEIVEVYVPIFEARLIGPNKKIGILRIDAIKNKIL